MIPETIEGVTESWLLDWLGDVGLSSARRIGEDHGFASKLVHVTGRLATGEPFDLVVKLGDADRLGRELWFYRTCADSTPLAFPSLRFGALDNTAGRAVVALEYLRGAEQGDVLVGTTDERITAIARSLARMHHRWWGAEQTELSPIRGVEVPRWLVRMGRVQSLVDRYGPRFGSRGLEELRRIEGAAAEADAIVRNGPPTLIHGDVHLDNVMFGADDEVFLLDWEGVRIGTPAEDLVRLAVERGTNGRIPLPDLVDVYLDEVARLGGAADPDMLQRSEAALIGLQAGVINWVGNPERHGVGGRREEVAAAAVDNVLLFG